MRSPRATSPGAADLIEPLILPIMHRGEHATMQRWMAALPDAALAARPTLCLRAAQALLFVGPIDETARPLAMAEQAWRGGDERNRQTGGAGLGLTIARRILQAHGGELTAANRSGGGAVFTGTLPLQDPAPPPADPVNESLAHAA